MFSLIHRSQPSSSLLRRFVRVCVGTLLLAFCLPAGDVRAQQTRSEPLAVGDQAPDFELPVQGRDAYLKLSDLIEDGPVVVVVLRGYPGYQCPICSRQVGGLRNRADRLSTALGKQPNRVVLVYPGPNEQLDKKGDQFLGGRELPDPLVMVRDPGMSMVTSWGLRWDAPRETAYPSVYLIGPGKQVKWAKVSQSHGGRAQVEEILQAINKL